MNTRSWLSSGTKKGQGITMITKQKGNLAKAVAELGLPPLRADNGLVELSFQEYRAKMRGVIENYPADRIPKVGDDIKLVNDARIPETFVVMEVKHLLVPRKKETIRAVLLLIERAHHA
jgi:hypothetical protein